MATNRNTTPTTCRVVCDGRNKHGSVIAAEGLKRYLGLVGDDRGLWSGEELPLALILLSNDDSNALRSTGDVVVDGGDE